MRRSQMVEGYVLSLMGQLIQTILRKPRLRTSLVGKNHPSKKLNLKLGRLPRVCLFAASSNAIDASVDESDLGPSSARLHGPARQYAEGSLNQVRTALPINSLRNDTIPQDDRCNASNQPSASSYFGLETELEDVVVESSSSYDA